MRTKYHLALAISLALSLPATHVLAQNETKESLTVPLTEPGKPGSLRVNLVNGTIHVSGYSGNQVIIEGSTKTEDEKDNKKDEQAGGMRRIRPANAGLDITATVENNDVRISSRYVNKTMNLNIKVPQKFALKVGTVNNGDVIIENVDGEMEITNVNGDIRLTNISGSAVANTVNGTLKANFKNINAQSPMAFSTLNGSVDVTLPATAKFDVKLKSDRGEIYSDFDVDVNKTAPQPVRTNKEGMYKVSLEDWVRGKVNGGGSEIMMKNMNGNIYVRKAK